MTPMYWLQSGKKQEGICLPTDTIINTCQSKCGLLLFSGIRPLSPFLCTSIYTIASSPLIGGTIAKQKSNYVLLYGNVFIIFGGIAAKKTFSLIVVFAKNL